MDTAKYCCKLPYPIGNIGDPEFIRKKDAFYKEKSRIEEQFKRDLFDECKVSGSRAEIAYQISWDKNHSGGFFDIASMFYSLLPLIDG